MSNDPVDSEPAGIRKLQDWWLELPVSYRVNALLYLLAGFGLLFLVSSLVGDGENPRRLQVGAGVTVTTSTTTAPPRSTLPVATAPTQSTSTTVGGASTTTVAAASPAAPSRLSSPSAFEDVLPAPAEAPSLPPTDPPAPPPTDPPECSNSQDPRCGEFRFEPPPFLNAPLTINVTVRTANPRRGQPVVFEVSVTDPDHPVSDNCSVIRFGDNVTLAAPCVPPPGCPPAYGPWSPPPREPGFFTRTYTHVYDVTGMYTANFAFRSQRSDLCPELDPYANSLERLVVVNVMP